jgi:hypothetical protein
LALEGHEDAAKYAPVLLAFSVVTPKMDIQTASTQLCPFGGRARSC